VNFTPNEIQNIVFKKSTRGFNQDQVWDFLEKVIEDYNHYIKMNLELKERLALLEESINRYKSVEETLQNTLLVAQQTADDIKAVAQRESEHIINTAQTKATSIIEHANDEVLKIKLKQTQLKKSYLVYKTQLETLVRGQLELLASGTEETDIKEETNVE